MRRYLLAIALLLSGCISVFPDSGEPAKKLFLSLCPVDRLKSKPTANVLIVDHPHASGELASKNLRIIRAGNCIPIIDHIAEYEWEEKLPDFMEAAIVSAIEQSNVFKGIAKSSDWVKGDLTLITEIRRFEVVALSNPRIEVELAFKVVTANEHTLLAQHIFKYEEPIECVALPTILDAYMCAVDQLLVDLTSWLSKAKLN
jgi:cholesterol transport system auxiliary component